MQEVERLLGRHVSVGRLHSEVVVLDPRRKLALVRVLESPAGAGLEVVRVQGRREEGRSSRDDMCAGPQSSRLHMCCNQS